MQKKKKKKEERKYNNFQRKFQIAQNRKFTMNRANCFKKYNLSEERHELISNIFQIVHT